MRFQTKMTMTYAVFILLAGVIIAIAYHAYSVEQYRKTEEINLEVVSQQVSNQIDEMIKPMETRMQYILSDAEILQSIRLIADRERSDTLSRLAMEARNTIQRGLNIDYVVSDFFRVIVFNPAGEVISTRALAPFNTKQEADFSEMPWLEAADDAKGVPLLVGAHTDNWGARSNPEVFSLVKAIQGSGLGYIEVQRTIEDVQNAINLPKEGLGVVVFINGGDLLYSNEQGIDAGDYGGVLIREDFSGVEALGGVEQLIAKTSSSPYGVTVLVMESMAVVREGSNSVAPIAVAIALVFCLISLAFVLLASHFLSKPLRELRTVMERTRLENLEQEINVHMPNNELEALNVSYQNVLERLKESIVQEKRMSLLHIQAQFDLLQAQVNPHFLYNVLNVIAQRGLQNGDEEICNICSSLAGMLRYSTNTKQRYATIREELEYLNQYFYLLKSRYEHKLQCTVEVSKEIQEEEIPKIVLQQIVENSINHGFVNKAGGMEVTVTGQREGDRWCIRISDNGQGFDEGRLRKIEDELEETRRRILHERGNMELEIGGMGLVNTYARLLLLYGEELEFRLENSSSGAEVLLCAPMNPGEGRYV